MEEINDTIIEIVKLKETLLQMIPSTPIPETSSKSQPPEVPTSSPEHSSKPNETPYYYSDSMDPIKKTITILPKHRNKFHSATQ